MAKKFKKNSILKPIVKYPWDEVKKSFNKKNIVANPIVVILLTILIILNIIVAVNQHKISKTNENQYKHINFIYNILLDNELISLEK